MLVEFSIKNFRSIAEKQTFSMLPAKGASQLHDTGSRYYPEVLKAAAVYGPNGSGKTNFVTGLQYLRRLVSQGAKRNSGDKLPYEPFILDSKLKDAPTELEIVFVGPEDIWRYGISLDAQRIHREFLFARRHETSKERRLFERQVDVSSEEYAVALGGDISKYGTLLRTRTNSNQLFLSKLDQFDADEVVDAYHWIAAFLRAISRTTELTRAVTAKYCETEGGKNAVISFLHAAGVQIDDVDINSEKFEFPESDGPMSAELYSKVSRGPETIMRFSKNAVTRYDVQFGLSGRSDIRAKIDYAQESAGTKNLFALAGPILETLEYGFTLIVDELNQTFHSEVLKFIVDLFNSTEANSAGAQLIFTSHDISVMNRMERDQIWFCEKESDGASELYPLSEFSHSGRKQIRREGAFGRQYLQGRYNALPEIDQIELIRELKKRKSSESEDVSEVH